VLAEAQPPFMEFRPDDAFKEGVLALDARHTVAALALGQVVHRLPRIEMTEGPGHLGRAAGKMESGRRTHLGGELLWCL